MAHNKDTGPQGNNMVFDSDYVRDASSITLDLLSRNRRALQERIQRASDRHDEVENMWRAAQQRHATMPDGRKMVVRLYALPFLVSFETEETVRYHCDPLIFCPKQTPDIHKRFALMWSSLFAGSAGSSVMPIPRFVSMRSMMSADPTVVHQCVFHGASFAEGATPKTTWPVSHEPQKIGEANNRIPAPFLALCYVYTPVDQPAPKPNLAALDLPSWQSLLAGLISTGSCKTTVTMFPPQGFRKAYLSLRLENFWHVMKWHLERGIPVQAITNVNLTPGQIQHRFEVHCEEHGKTAGGTIAWTWDAAWSSTESLYELQEQIEERVHQFNTKPERLAQSVLASLTLAHRKLQ